VRRSYIVVLALSAALVGGACGPDTAPADAAPGEPTLAAVRSDILNSTCALGSCHAPATNAAKLNLSETGICHLLVNHASCLFPDKLLVVPGKPEASFLLDKLRGINLEGTPNPECGTTNERMPLGQPSLPSHKLAQIEEWIRSGAPCGGDVPPIDAPADAAIDAPIPPPDIVSLSAPVTAIRVGERIQVTITLASAAPANSPPVILTVDNVAVVSVDSYVPLVAGVSSATFDVIGQSAGTATITASLGMNSPSRSITITVSSP
jgi:hypothetical protein